MCMATKRTHWHMLTVGMLITSNARPTRIREKPVFLKCFSCVSQKKKRCCCLRCKNAFSSRACKSPMCFQCTEVSDGIQ